MLPLKAICRWPLLRCAALRPPCSSLYWCATATCSAAFLAQVSLDGYLTVDPASLGALQIFQEEAHPAAAMGIGAQLLGR